MFCHLFLSLWDCFDITIKIYANYTITIHYKTFFSPDRIITSNTRVVYSLCLLLKVPMTKIKLYMPDPLEVRRKSEIPSFIF